MFTTRLEPKIEPNKTIINISDIKAQVNKGQEKQGKGINIQSNDISIKDINDFMKFKILKYKTYNLKDNELWEVYKEDFQNFTLQIFKDYN